MDLSSCAFEAVEQISEIPEQRWFQVRVSTASGRLVRVNIQLECEETTMAKKQSVVFTLTAQAPGDAESDPEIEVIRDSRPGCSFVWPVGGDEVRDVRVYVQSQLHGQGYGFAVVTFIKALFFPYYVRKSGEGHLQLQLPIGGARGVRRCSVLPVTPQARGFYQKQGFKAKPSLTKWYYEPAALAPLLASKVTSLSSTAGSLISHAGGRRRLLGLDVDVDMTIDS